MARRFDVKQPTTRGEGAKARRLAQGRRNTAAWRRRQRQEEASVAKPEPVVKDPVWADPDPPTPRQTDPMPSGSAAAGTSYDPHIEVDADGNVTVTDPAADDEEADRGAEAALHPPRGQGEGAEASDAPR